ncbi:MAG: hypothetical protein ACFCGT_05960 [Sandaracinaceae bacterium]
MIQAANRRRAYAALAAVAGLLASACGGGDAGDATIRPADPTGGGEAPAVVATPAVPTGPPLSYVRATDKVRVRVDMERVRASRVSRDLTSLIRSYPSWQELLGASGIDPVEDFDRVILLAPSVVSTTSVLYVRHHLSEDDVRSAVLRMATDRGTPPAWREERGFPVVAWPAETEVPRHVVLTGPGELVVGVEADLPRLLDVAEDHRLRRTGGDEALEPALALPEGAMVTLVVEEVPEEQRAQVPHSPTSLDVVVRADLEQAERYLLDAVGSYPDEESAEAARAYLEEQRDRVVGQALVRAIGLDRPLRQATVSADGERLELHADFTDEELERMLGVVALGNFNLGGG